MPKLRAVALAVLLVSTLSTAAIPVALAQQGNPVRAIAVTGNQRIDASTVQSYLGIAVGDAVDDARLDEALRALFATGLFEDVNIELDGDRLNVTVKENPIINRVAFEGNQRLTDDVLESEVQLRPRTVFTRAKVQSAVSRLLELYRRNGRYAATVEPKTIELEQNRVDLVFEINEGPRTGVGGINFVGNTVFSDSRLRGAIRTKETAWYRFFTSDDTYDPDRLQVDADLLTRYYRDRGFAEAVVRSAVPELSPDGSQFFITFTIDEGEAFTFGPQTIASEVPDLDAEQLQALLRSREGDVYSADMIERSIQAMTDRLGQLGYAFTRIDAQPTFDREAKTVAINYVIQEGPRVYVERIDITGNVRTLDAVIRREFALAEGDAFNTALLRRTQQRIRSLGFFESVNVNTRPGSAADRVIIEVEVREQSTGELSFGAGYSTTDGLLGDIRLSERNLLGRGQEAEARLTVSGRRQDIEFSFTEPYFQERDLAVGFDIFARRTDYQDESSFNERNIGFTVRAAYPLTENWRHTVRYTLRQDEILDVDDDASPYIKQEEGDEVLTSQIGWTFLYDVRDQRFLPNEGYVIRLDQDFAGLGGDSKFFRNELRAEYFYSLFTDVVLDLSVSGGYIFGWGGDDVRLANRFFLGGSSLRGFQFSGIGPRDENTDDALGGNLYYVGSAEVRFPIGLPEELRVFGRAFVDAGTLTQIDLSGPGLVDSGNLRVGAGVGLSWLSPFGPLAIDVAQAVVKDDLDQTETFRVSFGTRF